MILSRFSIEMLPSKFQSNVEIRQMCDGFTPCWCWTGRLNRNGYARVCWEGREPVAHREAYKKLVGPIPAGLVLDHKCRIRRCINPEHMDPVTHKVNILRGEAVLFRPAVEFRI